MSTTPARVTPTADVALFGRQNGEWHVLLVNRRWAPYEGRWALPGGHVDDGETAHTAARRELSEETNIASNLLHFVGLYDEPGRDPRGWYWSAAYWGIVPGNEGCPRPEARDDAREAQWFPVADITDQHLAFDHARIVGDADALRRTFLAATHGQW